MAFKVLWVGGPPGKTFQKIVDKLATDEIEVVAQQDSFTAVPTGVDAVLANIDMLGHSDFDASKAEAKRLGIKFAAVRLDYTRTRRALEGVGLVTSGVAKPTALVLAEAQEALAANVADPAEVLRTLLRSLPTSLAQVAVEVASERLEEAAAEERAALAAPIAEALLAASERKDRQEVFRLVVSGLDSIAAAALLAELKPRFNG